MTCVNEIILVSVLCQRRLANNASGQKAVGGDNNVFSSAVLRPLLLSLSAGLTLRRCAQSSVAIASQPPSNLCLKRKPRCTSGARRVCSPEGRHAPKRPSPELDRSRRCCPFHGA